MAIKINKTSGGSSSISTTLVPAVASPVHKGRHPKSTRFIAKAGNASATMIFTEPGASLILNTAMNSIDVNANVTQISFDLVTNTYKLKFNKIGSESGYDDNDSLVLTTARLMGVGNQSITSNDEGTQWGVIPDGDPGKDAEYTIRVTFHFNPNTSISSKRYAFNVMAFDENGNYVGRIPLYINHAAGSAYVYWGLSSDDNITNAQATMTQEGNPITTYVMSNTSWAITQV